MSVPSPEYSNPELLVTAIRQSYSGAARPRACMCWLPQRFLALVLKVWKFVIRMTTGQTRMRITLNTERVLRISRTLCDEGDGTVRRNYRQQMSKRSDRLRDNCSAI